MGKEGEERQRGGRLHGFGGISPPRSFLQVVAYALSAFLSLPTLFSLRLSGVMLLVQLRGLRASYVYIGTFSVFFGNYN